jgi:ankyrin repeat protein
VLNNLGRDETTIMHVITSRFKEDERFGRVVQLCCNAGVDINILDSRGCTALHLAVRDWDNWNIEQTTSQLQMLVDHGANINAKDRSYSTPLHHALAQRDLNRAGISFLLDHGAQTSAMDLFGRTPLHVAAERQTLDKDIVQQQLDHGADINSCDNMGTTLLDDAIRASNSHNIEILTRLGAVEGRRSGAHLADCNILPTLNLDTLETRAPDRIEGIRYCDLLGLSVDLPS